MFKSLALIAYCFIFMRISFSQDKDICGREDDRELSYKLPVGRVLENLDSTHGCTATLIGPRCAISAGHCVPVLRFIEFNTPISNEGALQHSDRFDQYEIDLSTIVYSKGIGQDFAVFKILPHHETGFLPGDIYGFEAVSFKRPSKRMDIMLNGYGASSEKNKNYAQQKSLGKIKKLSIQSLLFIIKLILQLVHLGQQLSILRVIKLLEFILKVGVEILGVRIKELLFIIIKNLLMRLIIV